MKPKLNIIETPNGNDCWCRAISLATQQPYNKIYKLLSPFKAKNGGLYASYIKAYLYDTCDFSSLTFPDFNVYDVMGLLDTRNNHVVIAIDEHILYVHKNIIYDGSLTDKDLSIVLNSKVNYVAYKEIT